MKRNLCISSAFLAAIGLLFRLGLSGHDFIGYIFIAAAISVLIIGLAGKGLKRAYITLLVLGAVCFTVIEVPIIKASTGDYDNKADYLIVLGAAVHGDTLSQSLADRLVAAKEYLISYPDSMAVLTGGKGGGENISEAEAMRSYLVSEGIAPDRLVLEDRATDTRENLSLSFELIDSMETGGNYTVAVLSSEYHLYRVKLVASELGRSIVTVPAHTSYPSVMINYFIREAFGVVYYKYL